VELVLLPVAFACGDVLTSKRKENENKGSQTYPESIEGLVGGGVHSEDHTSLTVTREKGKGHQQPAS